MLKSMYQVRKGVSVMGKWEASLLAFGAKLSSIAVIVATVLAPTCRDTWYQPKEPENLKNLLKK